MLVWRTSWTFKNLLHSSTSNKQQRWQPWKIQREMSITVIPTKTSLLMLNEAEDKQCSNRMHAQNSRFCRPGIRIIFNHQHLSTAQLSKWRFFYALKIVVTLNSKKNAGSDRRKRRAAQTSSALQTHLEIGQCWTKLSPHLEVVSDLFYAGLGSTQWAGGWTRRAKTHTSKTSHVSGWVDTHSKNIMCQWRGWTHT